MSALQKIIVDFGAVLGINIKDWAPLVGLALALGLVAGTMVFAARKFRQVR